VCAAAVAGDYAAFTATPHLLDQARASGLTDADITSMLADANMRVTYIDGLSTIFPGAQPTPEKLVGATDPDQFLRTAEALGATGFNVMHYQGGPTPMDALADGLGAFAGRAAEHGWDVFVEFLPGTGIPDLGAALALLDAVHAPNVSVMFDTLHFHRTGGRAADLTPDVVERIGGLQVSDWPSPPPPVEEGKAIDRLLPGEGALPLADMLQPLLGRGLLVGVEIFSRALRRLPPGTAAADAAAATRRVLDRIPA
jgi:sugar phosphate isomerase/epimerase